MVLTFKLLQCFHRCCVKVKHHFIWTIITVSNGRIILIISIHLSRMTSRMTKIDSVADKVLLIWSPIWRLHAWRETFISIIDQCTTVNHVHLVCDDILHQLSWMVIQENDLIVLQYPIVFIVWNPATIAHPLNHGHELFHCQFAKGRIEPLLKSVAMRTGSDEDTHWGLTSNFLHKGVIRREWVLQLLEWKRLYGRDSHEPTASRPT